MEFSAPITTHKYATPAARLRIGTAELWAIISIAAVPLLVKLLCYPSYPGSDDVFVHFRIVRNFVAGLGWGMDPHQPLNLSSGPLYTALLALCALFGLDPLPSGMFISAAAGFLAVVALHRLLVVLGLGPVSRVAGAVLAASNIYLWRWNGTAMETTLAILLVTLACVVFHGSEPQNAPANGRHTRAYLLTGVIVGLAVLSRFELVLILPCFAVARLVQSRNGWFSACVTMGAGTIMVILPWIAFSLWSFDSLIPTPFVAKTSSGLVLWNPAVTGDLIKLVVSSFGLPLLALAALTLAALRRRSWPPLHRLIRAIDIWLFPLVLATFYYLKTPALQSSARYYLPALHLIAAVFACMLHVLLQPGGGAALRRAVYVTLASHVAVALLFNQWRVSPVLDRYRDEYWRTMESAAEFLRGYDTTAKEGVLVEIDFGTLWYYAGDECQFFDGGAVASPDLRGLTVEEKIRRKQPRLIVETLGTRVAEMADTVPGLQLVWHREFRSHSISRRDATYVCNIYKRAP